MQIQPNDISTHVSANPQPKTRVIIFILIVVILIGTLTFFNVKRINSTKMKYDKIEVLDLSSKKDHGLKEVYIKWSKAANNGDIEDTFHYITKESIKSYNNSFYGANESVKSQIRELLKLFASDEPESIEYGAEIIENDRGVLKLSSQNNRTTVTNPRIYGIIFFIKESEGWKIDKEHFTAYIDVTPTNTSGQKVPIKFFWHPQFHANHTKDVTDCEKETIWQPACYSSWAVLNLDVSLCHKIPDTVGMHSTYRLRCFEDLAKLTGNASLCDLGTNLSIFEQNIKFCKQSISRTDFLKSTNIFMIDSDKDGLTDIQESYFNTNIANSDSDDDGVSDGEEVQKDMNPLGLGRLGDHLLN